MDIQSFIDELQKRNIELMLDGEGLRSRSMPGAIDADLANFIRSHKADIVRFLRDRTSEESKQKEKCDSGEGVNKQLSYWVSRLQDIPETHNLPLDKARISGKRSATGEMIQEIDADLIVGLEKLAQSHGTNMPVVLYSAFVVLLSRWSNSDDIVLGVPIAICESMGSPVSEHRVNGQLVMRSMLSETMSFGQLIEQSKAEFSRFAENKDVRIDQLLEALRPDMGSGTTSLFQNRFAYHFAKDDANRTAEAEMELRSKETIETSYDIDFQVLASKNSLTFQWRYAKDLFLSTSIEKMASAFRLLIADAVENERHALHQLRVISDEEIDRILGWNFVETPYPLDRCVHQLVEAEAERSPHRIALVCGERSLSYSQLNGKANALAQLLIAKGVGEGDVVPVLMNGELEVPLSYLAIMKTGAAFAPLDLQMPVERLAAILNQLSAKAVLTNSTLPDKISSALDGVEHVDINRLGVSSNPGVAISSRTPVYVIHTSGSTGVPKGAINIHRGIVNRLSFMSRYFGEAADEVVLQTTNHCFDSSVWQFFWPLIKGGTSVLPKFSGNFDLNEVISLILQHGVTMTDFTPALLSLFSEVMNAIPEEEKYACRMRNIIVGGEELTTTAVKNFFTALPRVKLHNFYGPSEASIGALCCEVVQRDSDRVIPIGRPIDNVAVAIVDRHLAPVPVGVPGELLLGGECVGAGYLSNKDETKRNFITNPFPQLPGFTMYRTGDLVRYRADGVIEYLGRLDSQVKILGHRIEMGEIQVQLERLAMVQQAVVRILSEEQRKILVAYVIPRDTSDIDTIQFAASLKSNLQESLPRQMIPTKFLIVDKIPLKPNGKVDFNALSPIEGKQTAAPLRDFPNSVVERKLADIWASQLKVPVESINMHSSFFDLGGDSLGVIWMSTAIKSAFGKDISVAEIFQNPTIFHLSRFIGGHASQRANRVEKFKNAKERVMRARAN